MAWESGNGENFPGFAFPFFTPLVGFSGRVLRTLSDTQHGSAVGSTLADDASVNREDSVGETEDFVDIARVNNHRRSPFRCPAQRIVHRFRGPDV